MGRLIFGGLILRLILMPFTGHEDLRLIQFASQDIFSQGLTSIYATEKSVYPPPIYVFSALWQKISNTFLGEHFRFWLSLPTQSSYQDPFAFRYLFLLKLPYLLFDFGILYLLWRWFKNEKEKRLAALVWLFNPVVIYVTYMFGQFDIIPTFFALWAIYLSLAGWLVPAGLILGIGASFKLFPLYFLIPMLILWGRENTRNLGRLIPGILTALLGILPVILVSLPVIRIPNYIANVLSSTHTQIIQNVSFYIGGDQRIYVFVVAYTIFCLWLFWQRQTLEKFWQVALVTLLLFYSLAAFNPQWFLWITPFLVLWWVKDRNSRPFQLVLYGLYFLIVFFFEPTVHIGLFAPVATTLGQFPGPAETFQRIFFEASRVRSYLRSIFAGFAWWLIGIQIFEIGKARLK